MSISQLDTEVPKNASSAKPEPVLFCHGPRVSCPFPTVTAAFYHQVRTHGDSIAAKDLSRPGNREITYGELCRSASYLRARLLAAGVKPGDRIPLVVKRSIEMLIGVIAILSCGAQYVPLDGSVVPDRTLEVVLEQCGAAVVVCMSATKHRLSSESATCIDIEDSAGLNMDKGANQQDWRDLARSEDGCYVIYTSGTTGIPKGVDVSHANVTNLVCHSPGNLSIKKGTKVGQVLNISFDMAAWEILGCLCNGGTLVLRGSKWEETLNEVNVLICTPSILAKYSAEAYPNIKISATAGEPSNARLADAWSSNGRTYYNCCGPTETTIVNTMHEHVTGGPLTIGKPTPNNSVYILDENLDHVSTGVVGIMWAGGSGVSRGYVGLPEKTAERYLGDKFINDGTMMYNTGDLGRWREDGEIDIMGRVDDQVKVKGFRVELDGVSTSLASAPGVHKAVALLIDGVIHGFISPASIGIKEVQDYMIKIQPYYAIPSKFTTLEAFPLTNNGKVDKHALRSIAAAQKSRSTATSPGSNSNISLSSSSQNSIHDLKNSLSPMSSLSGLGEKFDLNAELPNKDLPRQVRSLRHRAFIVYRRLFSLVGLLNIGAALALIFAVGIQGHWLRTITAINLVVAVLVRQDFVINALYTLACSVPKSLPLSIRARCGKIYHLGGVHSGAAFCASAWLLFSNISATVCQPLRCEGLPERSPATQVLSWILTGLFAVMLGSAWPPLRKAHHDLFERLHRFVGWTMLALFWIQTMLSVSDGKSRGQSLSEAATRTPALWLLLLATCSIATSWFFLRKVPVVTEVLSNHAVRLYFGYTVPVNGSFVRLSRRPLVEWHSFATIPAPEAVMPYPKGHSIVVSNAGDWTQSCIKSPPTHIWIRGVPTCGVMRIATLYRRIVLIATGSGIGPVLGHVQSPSCPTQLIWSTPNPEKTFGKSMIDLIRRRIPGAVIHDTKTQGRPDLVKMGYNLARNFDAEAVIIIANEKITKKVVYGLETRGINVYGAIWDS